MSGKDYLAYDFGAESGRAIHGRIENGRIDMKEIRRFPTGMLDMLGSKRWNVFRLYEEMKAAMSTCSQMSIKPSSMGIDTWGVDFAMLNREGSIIGLPYAYRDKRTEGVMEEFFKIVPRKTIYEKTGIQFLPFNSIYQLCAMKINKSPELECAEDLLFIPDLFYYLFSGQKQSEFSFATTTQLYNPNIGTWDEELFSSLGLNTAMMQKIVAPGQIIGHLSDGIAKETGIGSVNLASVATHDTGSAVASVPATGKDWAYISSGTWSLMGVESDKPIINDKSLAFDLTNEGGVNGTYRVLKNIMGLWLLQQCRASWMKEKTYDYGELVQLAQTAAPFSVIINPDDRRFLNPADMPSAIVSYCKDTKQAEPVSIASYARTILESLALKYRHTLDGLREIYPQPINRLHIIGGGVKNQLLCQYAANATGLPVIAGPEEATAAGNLLVQALATGELASLEDIRECVRNSFNPKHYEPQETEMWEEQYQKFKNLIKIEKK